MLYDDIYSQSRKKTSKHKREIQKDETNNDCKKKQHKTVQNKDNCVENQCDGCDWDGGD